MKILTEKDVYLLDKPEVGMVFSPEMMEDNFIFKCKFNSICEQEKLVRESLEIRGFRKYSVVSKVHEILQADIDIKRDVEVVYFPAWYLDPNDFIFKYEDWFHYPKWFMDLIYAAIRYSNPIHYEAKVMYSLDWKELLDSTFFKNVYCYFYNNPHIKNMWNNFCRNGSIVRRDAYYMMLDLFNYTQSSTKKSNYGENPNWLNNFRKQTQLVNEYLDQIEDLSTLNEEDFDKISKLFDVGYSEYIKEVVESKIAIRKYNDRTRNTNINNSK